MDILMHMSSVWSRSGAQKVWQRYRQYCSVYPTADQAFPNLFTMAVLEGRWVPVVYVHRARLAAEALAASRTFSRKDSAFPNALTFIDRFVETVFTALPQYPNLPPSAGPKRVRLHRAPKRKRLPHDDVRFLIIPDTGERFQWIAEEEDTPSQEKPKEASLTAPSSPTIIHQPSVRSLRTKR